MAYCAGIGRWWDGRTGVDEMVDRRVIVIFRRNIFVSPPPPKIKNSNPLTPLLLLPRYVAMHTMQEDDMLNTPTQDPDNQNSSMSMSMNGYLDAGSSSRGGGQSRRPGNKEGRSASLVFAAVGGMLLPLLTQVGHAH